MLPESVLDALRKFDTPTICNVLELFDARPHTAFDEESSPVTAHAGGVYFQ